MIKLLLDAKKIEKIWKNNSFIFIWKKENFKKFEVTFFIWKKNVISDLDQVFNSNNS